MLRLYLNTLPIDYCKSPPLESSAFFRSLARFLASNLPSLLRSSLVLIGSSAFSSLISVSFFSSSLLTFLLPSFLLFLFFSYCYYCLFLRNFIPFPSLIYPVMSFNFRLSFISILLSCYLEGVKLLSSH